MDVDNLEPARPRHLADLSFVDLQNRGREIRQFTVAIRPLSSVYGRDLSASVRFREFAVVICQLLSVFVSFVSCRCRCCFKCNYGSVSAQLGATLLMKADAPLSKSCCSLALGCAGCFSVGWTIHKAYQFQGQWQAQLSRCLPRMPPASRLAAVWICSSTSLSERHAQQIA